MKHYEMLYLVSTQIPETELETVTADVQDWLQQAGAKVTKQESWGRRKLAYPISHEKYGYYALVEFDIETDKLADLNKRLTLHKPILRHLIVDKKPISAKELLMQEAAQQRAQARRATQDGQPKGKRPGDTDAGPSAGAPKNESKKVSLDDLDKKLDELLDTDMIS